ncbi:MAG TPA: hypothetical protein VK900_09005 [Anaerolineales bacterium]|nr:hypothetical protein [Anaerolineales bacterium]
MGKKSNPSKSPKKTRSRDKQTDTSDPLPGWPGYRTRAGRSGYDPIDTRTEAAHTAGTIIRTLLSGHIRNRIHLLALGVLGLVLVIPLTLAIIELVNGNILPWQGWIFFLVAGGAGLGLLINFIRNLIRMIIR